MDWISIVVSALAGGAAAGIAAAAVRNVKERRVAFAIITAVLFVVIRAGLERTVVPPIREKQVEKELRTMPFYNEIAEVDPATYAKVKQVAADALKNHEGSDAIAGKIAGIIQDTVPKYVGKASDDSVLDFIDTVVGQTENLQKKDPDACYYFLFPAADKPLVANETDEKTKDEMLAVMGKIVHSAVHSPQDPPDPAKAQALLDPVIANLQLEYGRDLLLIQQKPGDAAGRAKVCAITISLYKGIAQLPRTDASLVSRYILSADQSAAAGR